MPQPTVTLPQANISENWDDDFDFHSYAPSQGSASQKSPPTSSRVPAAAPPDQESWDDAYEDESISRHAITASNPTSSPHRKADTDEDVESWRWSGSNGSGDASEPPGRQSSSSTSCSSYPHGGFPAIPQSPVSPSSATPTQPPASTSFFAKMSPVKQWKARTVRTMSKARSKEQLGAEKVKQGGVELSQKESQRRETSPLKCGFFDTSLPATPTALNTGLAFPASQPTSPLAPVLTLPPISPITSAPHPSGCLFPVSDSEPPPVSSSVFPRKDKVRQNAAAPSFTPAATTPLVSTSTHNLPLSAPLSDFQPPHATPRRSSLSDLQRPQLKIPDRIWRAQRNVKQDVDDVKEFAACVDQLRSLQNAYAVLLRDLHTALTDSYPSPPSFKSPALILRSNLLPLSPKRRRDTVATTSPQTSPIKRGKRKLSLAITPSPPQPAEPTPHATVLNRLDAEYGVWWECAELLIELGGRKNSGEADRSDEDAVLGLGLAAGMTRGRRPRAATFSSEFSGTPRRERSTSADPPSASPMKPWQRRATTGRTGGRDLAPRQLALLRAMLESDAGELDPRFAEADRLARDHVVDDGSVRKKGKGGGGRGIKGLWRGIKRGSRAVGFEDSMPGHSSSCDSSTSDSAASPAIGKSGTFGSNSFRALSPSSPTKGTVTAADTTILPRRKRPMRRPSLAGIFGIGQKAAKAEADAIAAADAKVDSRRDDSSSDWDRMDTDRPLDTIRGTKRLKSKDATPVAFSSALSDPTFSSSSSPDKPSLRASRGLRLLVSSSSPEGAPDRDVYLSSPRSPLDTSCLPRDNSVSLKRLVLSPDNIRPLLGHARHVSVRLRECIGVARGMMGDKSES